MAIKPPLLILRRPLSGTEIQSYHFAHSPLLTRRVEFVNTRIRGNLGDNAPWNGQNCPLFHCHKAQIAADISKLFQLGAKSWKVHKFMQQDELGNLNLRQPARHLSRFENGNWGFFVVISKPIFPISPSWLSCSPDYDSAQISSSLHTSEWIQRNGQNDQIWNLEIYSFMLGNCIALHGSFLHRWPLSEVARRWWLAPYGFTSTVYRLSNFHARSQFTADNVSKHSRAIFHSRPDDFFGERGRKLRTKSTKEAL